MTEAQGEGPETERQTIEQLRLALDGTRFREAQLRTKNASLLDELEEGRGRLRELERLRGKIIKLRERVEGVATEREQFKAENTALWEALEELAGTTIHAAVPGAAKAHVTRILSLRGTEK